MERREGVEVKLKLSILLPIALSAQLFFIWSIGLKVYVDMGWSFRPIYFESYKNKF